MRTIAVSLALTLVFATAARADFVVHNQPPPVVSSAPVAPQPASQALAPVPAAQTTATASTNDVDQKGAGDPETPRTPVPPRFKMAYGFGNQVPLSFACKQIVPNAVRISYGPGADPNALVSWKGGDTWNHVLREAVRPLGLELVMTHMAVEIRR